MAEVAFRARSQGARMLFLGGELAEGVWEMSRTPAASIIMFLVAALAGALGQYLYKSGAGRAGGSVSS